MGLEKGRERERERVCVCVRERELIMGVKIQRISEREAECLYVCMRVFVCV